MDLIISLDFCVLGGLVSHWSFDVLVYILAAVTTFSLSGSDLIMAAALMIVVTLPAEVMHLCILQERAYLTKWDIVFFALTCRHIKY